ncbi:NUDIX hydrolase [Krasilnikovia sp. M28-CT-15]|uniref:NUDIX hydrolase n=1 Tax=Krasilnikovia sp. M28-CT-15 TaxID=3373540 RepID=UPI00387669CD
MTRLELPEALARRAREFTGPPVPPRPAATVALLHPETLEVYVLRRRTTMAFGGMYAFPGGTVAAEDQPETLRGDWAARLGISDAQAHAVVGAAARELFEEAGVLLAGRADEPDHTVGNVGGDAWEDDRAQVLSRQLNLSEVLARRGLRLRDDLLLPWARWITPEFEPRRFDTWFFVALLPAGQEPRDVSGEADRTAWIRPADADGLAMLPPTRVLLDELSAYERADEVVAASAHRDAATPVMPRVELAEDGGVTVTISRNDP